MPDRTLPIWCTPKSEGSSPKGDLKSNKRENPIIESSYIVLVGMKLTAPTGAPLEGARGQIDPSSFERD